MALTVIYDILMSKTRRGHNAYKTRLIKFISLALIIIGGLVTFGSADVIGWLELSLVGELAMLSGYGIWVFLKTYQGEDPRSGIAKQLKKIVLIG